MQRYYGDGYTIWRINEKDNGRPRWKKRKKIIEKGLLLGGLTFFALTTFAPHFIKPLFHSPPKAFSKLETLREEIFKEDRQKKFERMVLSEVAFNNKKEIKINNLELDTSEPRIFVNLPACELYLIKDGKIRRFTLIIGKPETQTPEVRDVSITRLVYKPVQHLPPTLIKKFKEKYGYTRYAIPYGDKHHMIGEWAFRLEVDGRAWKIGNGSEIAMHGTNEEWKFKLPPEERALSGGCMRVEKIGDVAEKIIGELWYKHENEGEVYKPCVKDRVRGDVVYESVVVAEREGKLIVRVYPDPYEKVDEKEILKNKLEEYGVRVSEEKLSEILKAARKKPVKINIPQIFACRN